MPTEKNLRVFLAISIPQTASSILQRQLLPLKSTLASCKLRWIPQKNWHITVKFIGALQTQKIPALVKELTSKLLQLQTFELELASVGWFPSNSKPLMLAAMPTASEPLSQLAAHVDGTLAHFGIARNSRPFRAHLSLARCHKGTKQTTPQLLPAPLTPIPVSVSHIIFYQSQFETQGVYYSKLTSFPLLS